MTGTAKQPKILKTHRTASQNTGTATYIDNMSPTLTPCRTMPPPKTKTKTNTSHSTRRPASGKVNTHWVHSYRVEHAEHFPAPMEMCMDDHHTQTIERTQ